MQVEPYDFTRHLINFFSYSFSFTSSLIMNSPPPPPPSSKLQQLTILLRPRARPWPIERQPWLKTRVYILWEQFRYCLWKPTHSSPWSFMPSLTPAGYGLLKLVMSLPHREVTGIMQYLEGSLEGSCRKPVASLYGLATAEQVFSCQRCSLGWIANSKTRATNGSPRVKVYKRVQGLNKHCK